LKLAESLDVDLGKEFAPVRGRGLKHQSLSGGVKSLRFAPVRGRGLKHADSPITVWHEQVRPRTGARIETDNNIDRDPDPRFAPVRGRGLKPLALSADRR